MQQWARIYIELPQPPSIPRERARVRSYLFLGMDRYFMHVVVEMAPTLLHLSVFLFYIGLVVFFFTIYKTVAIAILISVGIFGLAYLTLIILPCVDHSCPYRTPMSRLWWYLWHTSFSCVAPCLRSLLRQLHDFLCHILWVTSRLADNAYSTSGGKPSKTLPKSMGSVSKTAFDGP